MKSLKFYLVILVLSFTSVYANPADSTKTKFTDNQSIWGLKLGRFHYGGGYFSKDGVSGTFFNEQRISKYFYVGGSLLVYKIIGSNEGAIFLNGYLSYPLEIGSQKFFIKGGLGLATLGYINPVAMFEVEYLIWEFEKSAISISISECIPEFKKLMPPVISIGILF